jgi:hypothetical protein
MLRPLPLSLMIPHRPRYPRRAMTPLPGACEQLTRLVYELLDAHDDTARIATDQDLDVHWQAHLSYLRDLQRVAREVLARAGKQEGAQISAPADAPTREAGRFRRFGRLPNQIPLDVADHAPPPNGKGSPR